MLSASWVAPECTSSVSSDESQTEGCEEVPLICLHALDISCYLVFVMCCLLANLLPHVIRVRSSPPALTYSIENANRGGIAQVVLRLQHGMKASTYRKSGYFQSLWSRKDLHDINTTWQVIQPSTSNAIEFGSRMLIHLKNLSAHPSNS